MFLGFERIEAVRGYPTTAAADARQLELTAADLQLVLALQDANWNVVALVNSSGSVVERYDYTPFGRVTIMNGSYTVISSSVQLGLPVPRRAPGYGYGGLPFRSSRLRSGAGALDDDGPAGICGR